MSYMWYLLNSLLLSFVPTVFKEMLQTPENSVRNRSRKSSDVTGMKNSDQHSLVTSSTGSGKSQDPVPGGTLKPRHIGHGASSMTLSGKDRVKSMMQWLIKPKLSAHTDTEMSANNFLNVNDPHNESFEGTGPECPEHALKIYKSDQHFRYIYFVVFGHKEKLWAIIFE